jgi:hypothetical protein
VVYPGTPEHEKRAIDALLLAQLARAVDASDDVSERPRPFTIATLIQRGWLRLRHIRGRTYEATLTRAGSRELEQLGRERGSGGSGAPPARR